MRKKKAIALMSTGLDSLLAARIIQEQGVDVKGVCFVYQFDNLAQMQENGAIRELIEPLGIQADVIDISESFLPTLLDPPHGYGSGVNPCIDCHLFMLKTAYDMMRNQGFDFLVTGEVMGQRPMSQTKSTLLHMNKSLPFSSLIVRPLSAKLLPPTVPELNGWIKRDEMYDISGRSRKPQFALAEQLKIKRFVNPAGGCILTEPNFSRRAKILFKNRKKEEIAIEDLELLRYGRHFWINSTLHIIVGRDEKENAVLENFTKARTVFEPEDMAGPLVLAENINTEQDYLTAARLTARYCRTDDDKTYKISFSGAGKSGSLYVQPFTPEESSVWQI